MKKLLVIILTLFSLHSFAQDTTYVKVRGIPGAYNFSKNDSGDSLIFYVQGIRHALSVGTVTDLSNYYNKTAIDDSLAKKLDSSYHQSLVGINPIYFEVINKDSANMRLRMSTDSTLSDASDTTSVSSLAVRKYANRVDYVPDITGLENYVGNAKTVIVQDSLRGGVFNYVSTGIPDLGIVFNAYSGGFWKRQFDISLGVNVDWFGYNATEDSSSLYAAIKYAKSALAGLNFSNKTYKFTPKSSNTLYGTNKVDITGVDITGIPFFHGTGTIDCSNLTDSLYSLFYVKGAINLIDSSLLTASSAAFSMHGGLNLKQGDVLFALSQSTYVDSVSPIYKNGQRLIVDTYDNSTGAITVMGKILYSGSYYIYLNNYMPKFEVGKNLSFIAAENSFLCAFRTQFAEANISGKYKNFGNSTIQINASLAYINNIYATGIIGGNSGYSYGITINDLSRAYINNCDITGGTAIASGGGGRVFFGFNIGYVGDSASYIFPTDVYVTGGVYKNSINLTKGSGECISPHPNTNEFFISDATIYGSFNTGAANTIINNCNIYYNRNNALTVTSSAISNASGYGNLSVNSTQFHSYTTSGSSFSAIATKNKFNIISISNTTIDGYFSGANQPISITDSLNKLVINGLYASVDVGSGNGMLVNMFNDNYQFNNINLNKCYMIINPQKTGLNINVTDYTSSSSQAYGLRINSTDTNLIDNVIINNYTSKNAGSSGIIVSNATNVFINNSLIRNSTTLGVTFSNVLKTYIANSIVTGNGSYGVRAINVPGGATYSHSNNNISGNVVQYDYSTATPIYFDKAIADGIYATITNLALKANDNSVVHLTGTEVITGNKNFKILSSVDTTGVLNNSIELTGYSPMVFQNVVRNSSVDGNLFATASSSGSAGITYSSKTKLWENGVFGTLHTPGVNTLTYQYFGSGSDAAYNVNNLRLYPDKTVGLMTVNDAVGDFITRNSSTGLVTRRTAVETLADIGALPVLAPYITKSTSYTATTADRTIEVTATGTTQTLPTAVGITGKGYIIKLTAPGSATVATTSSQTIDGSATYSLTAQYKYVFVQSNGTNWIIIGNN